MSCLLVSKQVTNKPIVVYPNSGEHYDPVIKQWVVSLHLHCLFSFIIEYLHRPTSVTELYYFGQSTILEYRCFQCLAVLWN